MRQTHYRSNANLRVQSTEWNFLTPLPCPSSTSKKFFSATYTSPHAQSQQLDKCNPTTCDSPAPSNPKCAMARTQPAFQLQTDSESEDHDDVGDMYNDATIRKHSNMWQSALDGIARKRGWNPWDTKHEKLSRVYKNLGLTQRAKLMRKQGSLQRELDAIHKKRKIVRNLAGISGNAPSALSRMNLLPKKTTDSNFSEMAENSGRVSFRLAISMISPTHRRGTIAVDPATLSPALSEAARRSRLNSPWWIYTDNGMRQLLGKYADALADLRAKNYAMQKNVVVKTKPLINARPFLGEIRQLKEYHGTNLEKLASVRRDVEGLLKKQKAERTVGFMGDAMAKTLRDSKSLAEWCIDLHAIRGSIKKGKGHGEIAKYLQRTYVPRRSNVH